MCVNKYCMNLNYKQYPEHDQLNQYQQTILNIFGLDSFDENKVVSTLNDLYDDLENQSFITDSIKDILLQKAKLLCSTDLKMGFMVLYSYDYCDLYHYVIQNALEKKYTPIEFEERMLQVE